VPQGILCRRGESDPFQRRISFDRSFTVDVEIDLGFAIIFKTRIRLLGIDAPETRTRDLEEKKRGFETKKWLEDQLNFADGNIVIQTTLDKKGKYGRVLGILIARGVNLNEMMVTLGLAKVYGK